MKPRDEAALRRELVAFSHLCHRQGLLVGLDGNLSCRLSDELVLCTQAGCHKGLVTDDHLVVIDLDGKKVRGRGAPTSEMQMHLACYRRRPDVEAVVHAHPPMCIAFTVAGVTMARCILPEVVLTLGAVPTLPYETTGTHGLASLVGDAIKAHDAVMMDRHGAVAVGDSLLSAFCKLETMEHSAKIMKAARDLGGVMDLPPEESEKLRSMGLLRYGGPPEAVAKARQPGADLPPACTGCSGCGSPTAKGLGPAAGFTLARISDRPGPTRSGDDSLRAQVERAVRETLGA